MRRFLKNVWLLGVKEMRSIRADPILVVLIVYVFTFAIYSVATGAKTEVSNAALAVVDEDHSELSRRIADAMLPPYFREAKYVAADEAMRGMDRNEYVFLVEIPPEFEKDLLAGRTPTIQISADATAMALAGVGVTYIENIISEEIGKVATRTEATGAAPINVVIHKLFNPNSESVWFTSVMEVVNNVTMLAVILAGAALIREREHGTVEHLLVMPVTPAAIMLAKIWANGLVITIGALLSLVFVVHLFLGVPVAGSLLLFALGMAVYQIAATGLGIMLATFANSMPQFALLSMPVLIVLHLLSGSTTPMESMPLWLQSVMQFSPATHFVAFAQAVLYRGAGFDVVQGQLLSLGAIGAVFFVASLLRFRSAITRLQ